MNRTIKIVFIVLAVLLVFAAAFHVIKSYINSSRDYMQVFSEKDRPSSSQTSQPVVVSPVPEDKANVPELNNKPQKPSVFTEKKDNKVNILFLGIDRTVSRDETMGVYRTDTIMFASCNLSTKKADILCIPRDSYVYIPVIDKKDKINHAYVWGGMNKEGISSTINTVNNFIKYEKVDYYFAIDMEPVAEIVDKVGGVELEVELDMKTNGADLSKGYQLLDGQKALKYITWRYSGMGDIDRIKRQQKFLKAVYEKVKNEASVIEALNIVLGYNKYIQTDLNMTQMIALSSFLMELPESSIRFYDTPGYGEYIDGISYWIPDDNTPDIFKNQ